MHNKITKFILTNLLLIATLTQSEAYEGGLSSLKAREKSQEFQEKYEKYNIDYPNLDVKYYQYIKRQEKYYDKDIIKIISDVNIGEKKSGFFAQLSFGINQNLAIVNSGDIITSRLNPFLMAISAGHRNYASKSLAPGRMGYEITAEFLQSFGQNLLSFSGVGANLLIDFKYAGNFCVGMLIGSGIGIAIIERTIGANITEIANKTGVALTFTIARKHRIKLGAEGVFGFESKLISIAPLIGYSYVF